MYYKKRLKELRKETNLLQNKIEQLLNFAPKTYSSYEIEHDILPLKHLDTLAIYFNVSLDYLFDFTNIKNYENSNAINLNISCKRLKEFRKENQVTQVSLAKMLNVAKGTIANYECGRNFIATPFLYTICKKYNISADYLLGKTDYPKYLK